MDHTLQREEALTFALEVARAEIARANEPRRFAVEAYWAGYSDAARAIELAIAKEIGL